MRAPQWVSEFFEWRWAPCVGLTAGSLAFALLAVALIPTQFDAEANSTALSSSLDRAAAPVSQSSLFGASLTPGLNAARASDAVSPPRFARPTPPPVPVSAPVNVVRGFSPIADRPDPPAPPPAAPPPPPPVVADAPAPPPPVAPVASPAPDAAAVTAQQLEPDGSRRDVPVQ